MPKRLPLWIRFIVLAAFFCLDTSIFAQSAQTWVSGVGDDANPGTRTAPLRTFAGAISKTASGGEINALDPGGFGAVTITKGITLDGKNFMSSILSIGTPCINISAGTNVVILRNLNFNGGTYGVRIISAGMVRIENCVFFNSTTNAIDFQSTTVNCVLYLKNLHIHDAKGAALFVNPASGGAAVVENCIFEQCGAGVNASAGTVQLKGSTITGSAGAGLAESGEGAILTSRDNVIINNNPDGNASGGNPPK